MERISIMNGGALKLVKGKIAIAMCHFYRYTANINSNKTGTTLVSWKFPQELRTCKQEIHCKFFSCRICFSHNTVSGHCKLGGGQCFSPPENTYLLQYVCSLQLWQTCSIFWKKNNKFGWKYIFCPIQQKEELSLLRRLDKRDILLSQLIFSNIA